MNKPDATAPFATRLIDWQLANGRHDLPWQANHHGRDAYRIWLSEIMLQQTQVSAVIAYYTRFLERFPDLESLARAPLQSVLELWAGLGYYARARNLHRCAQLISEQFGGQFPAAAEALEQLPGIGRSTAAAIRVFAFGQRAAILDGNVKRVLSRCFGIEGFPGAAETQRSLWLLAETLLPKTQLEAYTQGLMDLGSSLCTRGKPVCAACPMHALCIARRDGRQSELPAPRPKKARPQRETSVLMLTDGRRVLLEQRPPTGIWGGLLALPEVGPEQAAALAARHGCRLRQISAWPTLKQAFTHFELLMQPLLCDVELNRWSIAEPGWIWLDLAAVESAALPTPIRRLLRKLVQSTAPPAPAPRGP